MDQVLTPREAAAVLRISERTVTDRRWLARVGLIPLKLGRLLRFRGRDLERLISRNQRRRTSQIEHPFEG